MKDYFLEKHLNTCVKLAGIRMIFQIADFSRHYCQEKSLIAKKITNGKVLTVIIHLDENNNPILVKIEQYDNKKYYALRYNSRKIFQGIAEISHEEFLDEFRETSFC